MLQIQVLTPCVSVEKSWEGRKYWSHTVFCLVAGLVDEQGKPAQAGVKIRLNDDEAKVVQPGQRYTLGPSSFFEKDGKLAFSPRLVPAAGAGGAK